MSYKLKALGLKGPGLPIGPFVPPLWAWYLEEHQHLVTMRMEVTRRGWQKGGQHPNGLGPKPASVHNSSPSGQGGCPWGDASAPLNVLAAHWGQTCRHLFSLSLRHPLAQETPLQACFWAECPVGVVPGSYRLLKFCALILRPS